MTKYLPLFLFLYLPFSQSEEGISKIGLMIEREINASSTVLPGLKARYKQCIKLKQINMNLKSKQPSIWRNVSLSLPADYVKNIEKMPTKEPLWEKELIGFSREKEFFYREQYVHINELFKYDLTDDGLCKLIKTKTTKKIVDNGTTLNRSTAKYRPSIIDTKELSNDPWIANTAIKDFHTKSFSSPALNIKSNNKNLTETIQDASNLKEKLAALKKINNKEKFGLTTKNSTPKMTLSESIDAIKKSYNSNNSNIQECDWVRSDVSSDICYWRVTHTYPSIVQRPIIIKKNYKGVMEQTTLFKFISSIPEKVMNPEIDKKDL